MTFERFAPEQRSAEASSKLNILYVEDEDTNWEVTEFSLRTRCQLTRARTDREAFTKLRRHSFDLILMDIQLAGSALNGIEITRVLRRSFTGALPEYAVGVSAPDVPIVFVTAYASAYARKDLVRVGGNESIYKPVDFVRLQLVLSRLMVSKLGG